MAGMFYREIKRKKIYLDTPQDFVWIQKCRICNISRFLTLRKKNALFSETMSMHVMLESKRLSFVSFLLPANLDEMAVI